VANFGTWRDVEGRLIWGINDFDEAFPLPYTIDLVRLAVSAHIAADESHLAIESGDACEAILGGYREGLASEGRPFVLAEEHKWLRDTVTSDLRDPEAFWNKMNALPDCTSPIPEIPRRQLEKMLPKGAEVERVASRIAGLGSLGRERYVMLARLDTAKIAREAKALCASACVWAGAKGGSPQPLYNEVLERSIRALDPFVRIKRRWIVRRLAPYCSRVDLSSLPQKREESRLLRAMGFEIANVHLGTRGARKAISADLKKRPAKWLHQAASELKKITISDFDEWRKVPG
jgi:hypothetical protein